MTNSGIRFGVYLVSSFLFGDNRGLRFSVRRLRLAHFFEKEDKEYEQDNFVNTCIDTVFRVVRLR